MRPLCFHPVDGNFTQEVWLWETAVDYNIYYSFNLHNFLVVDVERIGGGGGKVLLENSYICFPVVKGTRSKFFLKDTVPLTYMLTEKCKLNMPKITCNYE